MSDTDTEEEEIDEVPPDDIGDDDEDDGGGRKKGGRRRKLIMFAGIPLVVLIIGAAAYLFVLPMFSGGDEDVAAVEEEHSDGEGDHGEGEEGGEGGAGSAGKGFLEIPQQIVNLNSNDGTTPFLRFTASLELVNNSEENRAAVEANMPRILDNFITYMRELHPDETQGSASMFRLKQELLARINRAVQPVQVSDVLFTEWIVQ